MVLCATINKQSIRFKKNNRGKRPQWFAARERLRINNNIVEHSKRVSNRLGSCGNGSRIIVQQRRNGLRRED